MRRWIDDHVPPGWRRAAERGGASAIRAVRSRADYEEWYPVYGVSGLVAPTWPQEYGGLGLAPEEARVLEAELAVYNLGRLNPLGLNLAAPALFAHGTEAQRLRYLPPIVRNEEVWCQLFSEPGAGSDLASLATRAELRAGTETWVVTGQKVWSTWAHLADFGVLLARTDPDAPKRRGLTYFLIDLRQPGVTVRPLRHITGEHDFNEVFLDRAEVPDAQRVGAVHQGWGVANATLSGERQMVSGSGSGGVDRIGGSGADRVVARAAERGAGGATGRPGGTGDPVVRQELTGVLAEERVRGWTNRRVRAGFKAGRPPGPESSIGKVHQGELNQRIQLLAADLLGAAATAWAARGPCHRWPRGPCRRWPRGPCRRWPRGGPRLGRSCRLRDEPPVRGPGHVAQPGQHHRGWHDRGQQDDRGRASARSAEGARSVEGCAVAGGPAKLSSEARAAAPRYRTLQVRREGPVGWLVFDRPDAGNAMNAIMLEELEAAWLELDGDPAVAVIVNTGAGRAFQTGLDMVQLSREPEAMREQSRRTKRAELRLTAWHNGVTKPVIAAVNGVCAGGGLHFVADADVVIASSEAAFLDPHVSVGQVTAYEAITLERKSPMEPIVRMALAGRYERMTAARAHQLGILSEVVDTAGATARAGPGAGRDHRPQLAVGHGGDQARPVGCARDRAHRGLPGRRPGVDRHVGPPRPGGGSEGVRGEATRRVATGTDGGGGAGCPGDGRWTGWDIASTSTCTWSAGGRWAGCSTTDPNAQRDERRHARRVRGGLARARRRPRGAGHRPHGRGQGVPDRGRRGRDRFRRCRDAALPPVGAGLRPALHGVAPAGRGSR